MFGGGGRYTAPFKSRGMCHVLLVGPVGNKDFFCITCVRTRWAVDPACVCVRLLQTVPSWNPKESNLAFEEQKVLAIFSFIQYG
jgi:hypothetical protein